MRLEKVFTHRLVLVLRAAIPILVVVLVAIPAWNYFSRKVEEAQRQQAQHLPNNLAARTEGFTYSGTQGGRTLYTVHARTNLGFKDNKYMGEDVDVTVFGATENEPAKRIQAKNCSFDRDSGNMQFTGDVEFQLDDKTRGRTQELTYDHRDSIISSPQRTVLEQPGSMTAQANRLQFAVMTGLLTLTGDVNVRTADGATLESGSALFHQKENWATAADGVLITFRTGWIRGTTGRADLEADTYKPRAITIEGNVTALSQAAAGGDEWKLRAARVDTTVSAKGVAERMQARGDVEVEKAGGNTRQSLTGGEVDATLDEAGKVDLLEARQNARMVLGSDQTLRSTQIWSTAAGSIKTADSSVLQMGDSVIEGQQFMIQRGDIVTFSTARRANLRSVDRESSADRTEARFDSLTNSLLELVQTGDFQFRDADHQGRAQSARFEDGGNSVRLEGAPVVTMSQMRLEAGQIQLNQKDNSFSAATNVKTIRKDSSDQVLVTAGLAHGTADSIVYTENVQLWRGSAYIKAGRLEASGKDNRLHAEGKVQSNVEAIRAVSDELDYDESQGEAHYTGNVRAQKQDMILESRDMRVKRGEKDVREIVATDAVSVTRGAQRGKGDQAVYDAATDSITLIGNAEVRDKQHGTVQGARLIMKTSGNAIAVESGSGRRAVTQHTVKK